MANQLLFDLVCDHSKMSSHNGTLMQTCHLFPGLLSTLLLSRKLLNQSGLGSSSIPSWLSPSLSLSPFWFWHERRAETVSRFEAGPARRHGVGHCTGTGTVYPLPAQTPPTQIPCLLRILSAQVLRGQGITYLNWII